MKNIKTERLIVAAILFTVFCGFFCAIPIHSDSGIYGKVVRLHVIANSDSEEDQANKLLVRDAILGTVSKITENCADRAEAEAVISENTDAIRELAETTLRGLGCDMPVTVTVSEEKYPTREYEDFRLPAGEYCSLRVMIGEAAGKNWWCVLFPPLCTSAASAKDELVSAGFTPSQVRIITDTESPRYVLKFRILEFFGGLFG